MSFLKKIFVSTVILSSFALPAYAGTLSYDPYAAPLRDPSPASKTGKIAANILTYPLEIPRWLLDRGLVYFDEEHLLDKGQWMYEKGADWGFTPRLNGADFDLMRISRQRVKFPDATAKAWINYAHDHYFETGTKLGLERIQDLPFRTFGIFNYANRPEEHFYGIGPDSSKGEGTSYKMEETLLQGEFGYSRTPAFAADYVFAYKNVNITNGEDGGRGIIDNTFRGQNIPGLDGDIIISNGIRVVHDTRNQKELSTKGHHLKAGFSHNEGIGSSQAGFFKYEIEGSQYFRLASDRRVFAVRFQGEHNDEVNGRNIPFHQMAKLGGFGSSYETSHTLRGYDENRFFDESFALLNLEYRYTIYEYRDWKLDAILFWDEGQVFGEFSNFQLQDFRESYGVGFRVSLLSNVLLDFEIAHADEGTNFYVKSRSPF